MYLVIIHNNKNIYYIYVFIDCILFVLIFINLFVYITYLLILLYYINAVKINKNNYFGVDRKNIYFF